MRKFLCILVVPELQWKFTRSELIATVYEREHASGLLNTKVLLQHLIKADIFIQSVLNKSEQCTAAVRECAQMGGLFNKLGFLLNRT